MLLADPVKWTDAWTAVGTVVLALFAGPSLLITVLTLYRDHNRREEDERKARAAQARLVFPHLFSVGGVQGQVTNVGYLLINNSESRVTDVWVHIRLRGGGTVAKDGPLTVPQGKLVGHCQPSDPVQYRETSDLDASALFSIKIFFKDASGNMWARKDDEAPVPLEPTEWLSRDRGADPGSGRT